MKFLCRTNFHLLTILHHESIKASVKDLIKQIMNEADLFVNAYLEYLKEAKQ